MMTVTQVHLMPEVMISKSIFRLAIRVYLKEQIHSVTSFGPRLPTFLLQPQKDVHETTSWTDRPVSVASGVRVLQKEE